MLGKLVRINRASIGVKKGTLGLVIKRNLASRAGDESPWYVYEVLLCLPSKHRERRYLVRDLEVMEEVEVCSG